MTTIPISRVTAHTCGRLEARRDATRREVTTLDAERQRLAATVSEDQVMELLAEDAGAAARVTAGSTRLREIDAHLTQLRERAVIEAEAVRRLEGREPQIREAAMRAIRHEVEQVQRELMTLLAKRLEALVPVNHALLALKRAHWDAIDGVIAFSELDPRGPRLRAWLEKASALGVHSDL